MLRTLRDWCIAAKKRTATIHCPQQGPPEPTTAQQIGPYKSFSVRNVVIAVFIKNNLAGFVGEDTIYMHRIKRLCYKQITAVFLNFTSIIGFHIVLRNIHPDRLFYKIKTSFSASFTTSELIFLPHCIWDWFHQSAWFAPFAGIQRVPAKNLRKKTGYARIRM